MLPTSRTVAAIAAACSAVLLAPSFASAAPLNLKSLANTVQETLGGSIQKLAQPETLPGAVAGLVPHRNAECEAAATEQPFLRWGDRAQYVPTPNHDFEDGLAGWTPRGNPTVVADNEPWRVSGSAGDGKAIKLGDGDSITIGGLCGGLAYPTVRLFAKSATKQAVLGLLSVRYTGTDGLLHSLPLGPFVAGASWQPTHLALTLSGVPLLTGTKLGLQLTPLTGSIVLDDIYVDPYRRA